MEKMTCTGCCAPLAPTTTTPFLTCEYCGTTVANPHYDAATAAEVKPDLSAAALSALREMGQSQNLSAIDADCFGDPIHGASQARVALSIPDGEQLYFLYDHTFLFVAFTDGLALTDGGLYYQCDSGAGKLSWETFITGAISCVDEEDGQDGELRIGSSIVLTVKNERDSRLARFLVDFHNHVYHQHTGEAAPAAWCVTEPAPVQQPAATAGQGATVLGGLGALLGATVISKGSRTVTNPLQRSVPVHPTSHPTLRQDRRAHAEQPRPLHIQPHHRPTVQPTRELRPAAPARPAPTRSLRDVPAARPAAPSRPGQAKPPRNAAPVRGASGSSALRDFRNSLDSRAGDAQSKRKPGGRR